MEFKLLLLKKGGKMLADAAYKVLVDVVSETANACQRTLVRAHWGAIIQYFRVDFEPYPTALFFCAFSAVINRPPAFTAISLSPVEAP